MPVSLVIFVIALAGVGSLIAGTVKKNTPATMIGCALVVIAAGLLYLVGMALQNM